MSPRSIRSKVKTLPPEALVEMQQAAEASLDSVRDIFLTEGRAALDQLRHVLNTPQSRPADWHRNASRIAHDLKAQGTTFDYPLVTRIAQSLCGQLIAEDEKESARDKRALAHCEALRVIFDKDIRGTGGKYGARLLQILGIE